MRQVPSDITGEHSCVMLRVCNANDSDDDDAPEELVGTIYGRFQSSIPLVAWSAFSRTFTFAGTIRVEPTGAIRR